MRKVVVTGIGAVTPLGNSFQSSWEAAKAGLSGIGHITRFDTAEIKWKVAGELKRFDSRQYLSQKEINHLDPFVHYAVAASLMAVEDAGLINADNAPSHPPLKLRGGRRSYEIRNPKSEILSSAGVVIGSSRGGITTIERELQRLYGSRFTVHASRFSPYLMPSSNASMAASYVAQKLNIKGYCLGISNACASGANAIGEAYRLIKTGYKGPVIAGGTEAPICRLCIEGYGVSGAISRVNDYSASRPFDITRDGFVLAEGACILVLEDYENALKRNAKIYEEVVGYGNTADAFHPTMPSPEGEARAISSAIKDAGLRPEDIDFINAHATATPLGDKAETNAIKLVFGRRTHEIPITSVKSMTGHMLSASGAFEAAVSLMSIKEGVITPTINLKYRDPECDLNCMTETIKTEIKTAISNSFGFGGVNAVLAFKKI